MATRLPLLLRSTRSMCGLRLRAISSTRLPSALQCRGFSALQRSAVLTPASQHSVADYDQCTKRFYAKGKSKGKDKGKKSAGQVSLTSEELNAVVKYDKMMDQFQKVLDQLQRDYMTKLSIRTTAASFDELSIETHDGAFPLIQLGQIAHKSPTLVVVNLAAFPQYVSNVKSAFLSIGINPNQEGNSLIVPIPKVTREQRSNMAATAKTMCNKSKDNIRDIQNTFLRDAKKHKGKISDDLLQSVNDHIQKDSHDFTAKAEALMATKQKELMTT